MLIETMDKRRHIGLILLSFILFNVISSFSLDPIDTTSGYSFVNFIFLYLIGRYIRLYGLFPIIKTWQWMLLYFLFSICIMISYRLYGNYKFGTYNSVFLLLSSVCFFNVFLGLSIKTSFFSKIVPYTFAVYLITDSFYLRQFVNKGIIDFAVIANRVSAIVIMLLYGLVVMIICLLVDWLWKRLFGKLNDRIANAVSQKMTLAWNRIVNLLVR